MGQLHAPDTLHVAYWNLTSLRPGSRQPYWRSSCHPFRRALVRVPSSVTWLSPRRNTQGVKLAGEGLPPICRPYGFPPPCPMAAVQSVPNLRVQNLPIRLENPRLNWVPGAPPMNTPNAELHALRC